MGHMCPIRAIHQLRHIGLEDLDPSLCHIFSKRVICWLSLLQGSSFLSHELSTKRDKGFMPFFKMGNMLSYHFYRGRPSSLRK